MRTREERIRELLAAMPAENPLRLHDAKFAAEFLGEARVSIYRHVAAGHLGAVKGPGVDRRGGKGSAGRLKFRLLDLVGFQVDRELSTGPAPAPEAASTSASRIASMAARRAGGAGR